MSVGNVFDRYASGYDALRRKLIPCYDDFYGAVLDCLDFSREQPLRVLDLGAGTGLLSEMVAAAYPAARITLVDLAGNMLDQARLRLGVCGDRFVYDCSDYAKTLPDGPFDVIMSALSIHHLDAADKCRLFGRCYERLDIGGLFVNADQARGETPAIDRRCRERWVREVRRLGVSEDELAQAFERMKEDRMSTLSFQTEALQEAGFSEVNCWYRNDSFVVYSGIR
ncbi:MAG: class I SAM-dependent methyltransferase [Chlorobiales bacterium]|nr:class I SAM-dependent methyltransferase [Chlorobiales bacterium]